MKGATVGQVIAATFHCHPDRGGRVTVTHRDGKRVKPDPDWLSWPSVRGDEFGPPIQSQAELSKASRGRR